MAQISLNDDLHRSRVGQIYLQLFCAIIIVALVRVLARISKMPGQNSNFKNSARPDLATNLLQILVQATYNSLVCQKGQFALQLCPIRWFFERTKYFSPLYGIAGRYF